MGKNWIVEKEKVIFHYFQTFHGQITVILIATHNNHLEAFQL